MNKYKRKEEVEAIQYFSGIEIFESKRGEELNVSSHPSAIYLLHPTGDYRRIYEGDWAIKFAGRGVYMVMRDEEFKETYEPISQTLELAVEEIVKEHGTPTSDPIIGKSEKDKIIEVLDALCNELLEDYDKWSGIYDAATSNGVTKVEEKYIMTVKGKMYGSRDAWKRACKFRDSLKEEK